MLIIISGALIVSLLPDGISSQSTRSALRFGKTTNDYIQLPEGIMDNSRSQFSLCTWVRKRHDAERGVILQSFRRGFSSDEEIVLGDNGYFNYVVGTNIDLRSEYNVSEGTWFHVCLCWSTSDYTLMVYLNGNMIGFKVTAKRMLRTGSENALGNWASGARFARHTFGGDLFKLNIYNRVLNQSEIKGMAHDLCSVVEKNLSTSIIFGWEEIMERRRPGTVIELPVDCESEDMIRMRANFIESQTELNRTRRELFVLKENITEYLEITRENLASMEKRVSQLFDIAMEDMFIAKTVKINVSQQLEIAKKEMKQSGKFSLDQHRSWLQVDLKVICVTTSFLTLFLLRNQVKLNVCNFGRITILYSYYHETYNS